MSARTGLSFGKSGSRKTSELRWIARLEYLRTGKITRLCSSDGGGWEPLEADIKAGLIEAFHVSADKEPLTVWRKLSKGYWPECVEVNGQSGTVLVPPTPETWNRVGVYLCEGLASIAASIMLDHLAKQRQVSFEHGEKMVSYEESVPVLKGIINGKPQIIQEAEKFMFPGRGHYGATQQQVKQIVFAFESLPVDYVWFTTLETVAEDVVKGQKSGRTIIGPYIIGNALSAECLSWFGLSLHHDFVPVEDGNGAPTGNYTVRVHFAPHRDAETGLPINCKPRCIPELMPKYIKQMGGQTWYEPMMGDFKTIQGLGHYLQVAESLEHEGSSEVKAFMAEADRARNQKA